MLAVFLHQKKKKLSAHSRRKGRGAGATVSALVTAGGGYRERGAGSQKRMGAQIRGQVPLDLT